MRERLSNNDQQLALLVTTNPIPDFINPSTRINRHVNANQILLSDRRRHGNDSSQWADGPNHSTEDRPAGPGGFVGGFKEFQGYVFVSPNDTITSFVLDINVASVWTQFQKLTGHLKAADFFETDKFPAARFVSTGIKTGAQGQCQITGNLTLHGQTKSISFPAQYRFENGGLLLTTKFKLDRSQFGMNQMLSGVDKLVEVELYIGQPTRPAVEQPGHGSNEKKKPIQADADKETQHVSIDLPNMT